MLRRRIFILLHLLCLLWRCRGRLGGWLGVGWFVAGVTRQQGTVIALRSAVPAGRPEQQVRSRDDSPAEQG